METRPIPLHIARRLRRFAKYAALPVLLAGTALWLTFQHKPAWYRPVFVKPDVVQRARREAPNLVDRISDHLVRGEPIDIRLQERNANEWLAALAYLWPETAGALPSELSQPAIHFADKDTIGIGCLASWSGWRVILGARLSVELVEDGDRMDVSLRGLSGGTLPLPSLLAKPLLNRLLGENIDGGGAASLLRRPRIPSADDLYHGIRFDNRFEWPNGERMFRIGAIAIRDGQPAQENG